MDEAGHRYSIARIRYCPKTWAEKGEKKRTYVISRRLKTDAAQNISKSPPPTTGSTSPDAIDANIAGNQPARLPIPTASVNPIAATSDQR